MSVNEYEIDALISTGSQFVFAKWLDGEFHGDGGTYSVDVTADGYADGVTIIAGSAWVATWGGSVLGTEDKVLQWASDDLLGVKGSFLVDVDGDHRADVVVMSDNAVRVALSTGYRFEPSTAWKTWSFSPYDEVMFSDVDGDGRADAMLFGSTFIDVMLSTGSGFEDPVEWYGSSFPEGWALLSHDVDGDGRADAIRLMDEAVFVALSTGTKFEAEKRWYSGRSIGTKTTLMGDVDGDNRADLVQVNFSEVSVALSTGAGFAPLTVWYQGQFNADRMFGIAPDLANARAYRQR